jgi:ubiquinol-cytochrome c reductase cytochrome c subunit
MKNRLLRSLCAAVIGAAGLLAFAAAVQAASTGDAKHGRALFVSKGCYECHGYVGQGSIMSGPSIAPGPLPLEAIIAYVRAPTGQMPQYSSKILSDADVADIHAYLASIPANPDPDHIDLLRGDKAK